MEFKDTPKHEVHELFPKKHKYCVGIPLLNEGEKILKQLKRMQDAKIHEQADIIIFDGDSSDGSTSEENLKNYNVRSIIIKKDTGKQGAQFRMGFEYILKQGYEGIVTIDGNNKDSVEDIPSFIKELESGNDFIQGSRYIKGGRHENTPLSRHIGVRLIHAPWLSFISGFKYTDTTSAFRGISKRVLLSEKLNLFRAEFIAYELLFYMSAFIPRLGFKCKEIPVARVYPKGKVPTKITLLGNLKILKDLFTISKYKTF